MVQLAAFEISVFYVVTAFSMNFSHILILVGTSSNDGFCAWN